MTFTDDSVTEAFQQANQLNARLSSRYNAQEVAEARQLAEALLDYVKTKVADYEEFVRRVERSELFSLHESAQLPKNERPYRPYYLRAVDLLETVLEAEALRKPR